MRKPPWTMHLDCAAWLHCIVLLHIALAGEAKLKVEIACTGNCVQNKKTDIKFPSNLDDSFIYKPTEQINGTFLRNLGVEGGGECFDSVRYSLKGRNDREVTRPVVWEEDNLVPHFGGMSLCQQVSLYGYIFYRECSRDSGAQLQLKHRKIPRYPTFSPIQTWLEGKAQDKSFPEIHLSPENIPVISWGLASSFGCDSSSVNTMADINFKIIQEETGKIMTEEHTYAGPDIFKTRTLENLKIEEAEKNLEWNFVAELKLTFYGRNKGSSKKPQKSIIFKRTLNARDIEKNPRTGRAGFGNSSSRFNSGSILSFALWFVCIFSYSKLLSWTHLR